MLHQAYSAPPNSRRRTPNPSTNLTCSLGAWRRSILSREYVKLGPRHCRLGARLLMRPEAVHRYQSVHTSSPLTSPEPCCQSYRSSLSELLQHLCACPTLLALNSHGFLSSIMGAPSYRGAFKCVHP